MAEFNPTQHSADAKPPGQQLVCPSLWWSMPGMSDLTPRCLTRAGGKGVLPCRISGEVAKVGSGGGGGGSGALRLWFGIDTDFAPIINVEILISGLRAAPERPVGADGSVPP
jgi:hypothetical protein